MFYLILALVIVVVAIIVVVVSMSKKETAKEDPAIKLARIRMEREARAKLELSYPKKTSVVSDNVHICGHKKHYKHKHYNVAYTYNDKYELPTLVGSKRLVDRDAETNCLTNLYDSDKWELGAKRSHINVRTHKVNIRNARRDKKAYRDFCYNNCVLED